MRKTRKYRFFNDLRLRKRTLWFILSILVVCSAGLACADDAVSGGGSAADAVVRIRPNDAERLKELNRLREQGMRDAEKLKRLELELDAEKAAKARLEAELIEQKLKFQAEDERFRQLRLWLAGVQAEGTVRKAGEREEQQLQAIGKLSENGVGLALDAVDFCNRVQLLLRELPIGKVRQAEIQLRLDDLVRKSRRFIAMAEVPKETETGIGALRTCRILAVDRELRVAILSVGSVKGAFAGMIYHVGKDRREQLKLVSVRPAVAAAVLVRGSIENLSPGMEAVAGEERGADETGR
ncbi:hypothetical protein SDC9_120695 [bioreactor metagenome]|uniref:Uncharacterized protein n=1 Tax=bioreactor metagenome TaxID=1076179 RepID=A0A645C9W8_9ZZZZ